LGLKGRSLTYQFRGLNQGFKPRVVNLNFINAQLCLNFKLFLAIAPLTNSAIASKNCQQI